MIYRKQLNTTEEMAKWYDSKYTAMHGTWVTPPGDCNQHLDDLGVPFDKSRWLLDVGCGGGHFLAEAEKRVRCYGQEVSPVAVEYASKRLYAGKNVMADRSFTRLLHGSIEDGLRDDDGMFGDACMDYIVSIGSLEHVIDIDTALDEIRRLLKPDGRWYFYNPNEEWKHFDQPNERTATDQEWIDLFTEHDLITTFRKRWGACTAFAGGKP